MKECSICHESKPTDEFAWKSKAKGTRQACCDPCRRERQRQSYQKNKKAIVVKA